MELRDTVLKAATESGDVDGLMKALEEGDVNINAKDRGLIAVRIDFDI
jgi:hypothetical protein